MFVFEIFILVKFYIRKHEVYYRFIRTETNLLDHFTASDSLSKGIIIPKIGLTSFSNLRDKYYKWLKDFKT